MTNPDNIVRVRARNGGRASVYEANGWCQAFSTGLLEGNGVIQNTSADMNVLVGGSTTKPDVVIAQNASGYKIALDLVGQHAVTITAPASNKRISAIVAYTNDLSLSTTEDTVTGSPASCGLIVVNGTTASSPSAPTDTQIRNAISSDGATGSQAAYCVIATITVSSSTSVITDSEITTQKAGVTANNIDFATLTIKSGRIENQFFNTMNLTSGKWLIFGFVTYTTYGSDVVGFRIKSKNAGSADDYVVARTYVGNEGGQVWENLSLCYLADVASTDEYGFYCDKTPESQGNNRSFWVAIKLG